MLNVLDFGAKGDGVTDDAAAFRAAIDAMGPPGAMVGATLYVPAGRYRLASRLVLNRELVLAGDGGAGWGASTLLLPDPGVGGPLIYRDDAHPTNGRGDWTVIRDLAIRGAHGAAAHGVEAHARFRLQNAYVSNFSGDGVHVVGNAGTDNANGWSVEWVRVDGCGGHGLYVSGDCGNCGVASQLDVGDVGGWGVRDEGFLGNTYLACQVANCAAGAYATTNRNARHVFVACYQEDGQVSSIVAPAMILGGSVTPGAGDAGRLNMDGFELTATTRLRALNAPPAAVQAWGELGGPRPGVALGFGANDALGKLLVLPWSLEYARGGRVGVWSLNHANADAGNALAVHGVTSPKWAEGYPGAKFEAQAAYLAGVLHTAGTAPPTSGTWPIGARMANNAPRVGGPSGWVCVAAGTPGTWATTGTVGT